MWVAFGASTRELRTAADRFLMPTADEGIVYRSNPQLKDLTAAYFSGFASTPGLRNAVLRAVNRVLEVDEGQTNRTSGVPKPPASGLISYSQIEFVEHCYLRCGSRSQSSDIGGTGVKACWTGYHDVYKAFVQGGLAPKFLQYLGSDHCWENPYYEPVVAVPPKCFV